MHKISHFLFASAVALCVPAVAVAAADAGSVAAVPHTVAATPAIGFDASEVENTFSTKFKNNVRLALGQHKSHLASRSMSEPCAGDEKAKIDNIVGNTKAKKRTVRHADTQYQFPTHDGVWVLKPEPSEWATLVDKSDQLATKIGLTGAYTQAAASAIARAKDDAWLEGFYGDMITGKGGTVLNAFPAANVVPVATGGTNRMHADKIRAARKILAQNFVNMQQQFYMGLTAEQIEDLTGSVDVTSSDFRSLGGRLSEDGKFVTHFLGFEFVEFEFGNPMLDNADLTVDGSGYRKCPFWTADGMVMGVWEDLFASVDKLPGKSHATQVYASCEITASRTDQGRCGYILCEE